MRRFALALIVALFAVPAGAVTANAAPIKVNAVPGAGGAVVTATVLETYTQTIVTGLLAEGLDPTVNYTNGPGLCTYGAFHNSCTPANE